MQRKHASNFKNVVSLNGNTGVSNVDMVKAELSELGITDIESSYMDDNTLDVILKYAFRNEWSESRSTANELERMICNHKLSSIQSARIVGSFYKSSMQLAVSKLLIKKLTDPEKFKKIFRRKNKILNVDIYDDVIRAFGIFYIKDIIDYQSVLYGKYAAALIIGIMIGWLLAI